MALEKPRIEDFPALHFVGTQRRYSSDQLAHVKDQWGQLPVQLQLVVGRVDNKTYGLWFDVLKGGPMRLLSGVRVGEFAPASPQHALYRFHPQRFAVFSHRGHVSQLRDTLRAIFAEWLPGSGKQHHREFEDSPDFVEVYGENFDPESGVGDIEIWVPIKK